MKTTLEIPDDIFRGAKATAALRGIPMRQLVTEALAEKITSSPKKIKHQALHLGCQVSANLLISAKEPNASTP